MRARVKTNAIPRTGQAVNDVKVPLSRQESGGPINTKDRATGIGLACPAGAARNSVRYDGTSLPDQL